MLIHFHGAAGTTTGSMHLLEFEGGRFVLLDCGLFQGRRKEAFERNRALPFDARKISAAILSHAHIDHSGNLPSLVKAGYRGPIFTTPATRDLCDIMLLDSAHMQESDVKFANKGRLAQGQRPFEPLYTVEDIPAVMERFSPLPYGQSREIIPGVTAIFFDAGHILGSAITALDYTEGGRRRRLVFTGDLGRPGMPILRDPQPVTGADAIITESTYGDRTHPKEEDVKATLVALFTKAAERRSRLIIPAFSVGRTQQLLYFLRELDEAGRLPAMPIYVDSPLSNKATEVHERHPECFDPEAVALFRGAAEPFALKRVTFVAAKEDSQRLNGAPGPMAVISASGMCEGGRILHHLRHGVDDPANIILIVGFQAEHTLGRRIVEQQPIIRIFGEEHHLRAEVHSIQALSGHADHEELLAWFRSIGPLPASAFVVHGEPPAAAAMAESLRTLGIGRVVVGESGKTETV
jgi:metallo-beta-lactamase family protein